MGAVQTAIAQSMPVYVQTLIDAFRSMTCSEQVAIGTVVEMHHTDTRRHGLDSQVQFP